MDFIVRRRSFDYGQEIPSYVSNTCRMRVKRSVSPLMSPSISPPPQWYAGTSGPSGSHGEESYDEGTTDSGRSSVVGSNHNQHGNLMMGGNPRRRQKNDIGPCSSAIFPQTEEEQLYLFHEKIIWNQERSLLPLAHDIADWLQSILGI